MKLFLLSVLVISMSVELPPAVAEQCSDVLATWWDEGCEYDYSAPECILDEQDVYYEGAGYNPTAGCGWGGIYTEGRSHHYNCPGNEPRTCTAYCYVPCPGETTPSCSSMGLGINFENCRTDFIEPCSKETCGVGIAYGGFACARGHTKVCTMECCCKRCTGGPKGALNVRVCDAENMEHTLTLASTLCLDNII